MDSPDNTEEELENRRRSFAELPDSDCEFYSPTNNVTFRRNKLLGNMSEEEQKLRAENERLKITLELLKTKRELDEAKTELKYRVKMPEPREMESLVSQFDPKDPTSLSAEEWVKSIDSVAAAYGWTQEAKLYCARLQLLGAARLWYEGVRDEVANWQSFCDAIKLGFPTAKGTIHYHNLMLTRKKLPTETIEEYVYCMTAMGKRGGFDEPTIITYIVNGLSSFLSRSTVGINKVGSVQALLGELKWIESLQNLAESDRGRENTSSTPKRPVPGSSDGEVQSGMKKCFQCNKDGHWKRDCPLNSKNTVETIKVIQRRSAFLKIVKSGEINLEALVDTGAKVSTIHQSAASRLGTMKSCNKALQGFGLKQVMVTALCVLPISVDGIELRPEFHVVPDHVQEMPLILGEDVIDQDRLVMVKRKGEVRFQWEPEEQQEEAGEKKEEMVLPFSGESNYANLFKIDLVSSSAEEEAYKAGKCGVDPVGRNTDHEKAEQVSNELDKVEIEKRSNPGANSFGEIRLGFEVNQERADLGIVKIKQKKRSPTSTSIGHARQGPEPPNLVSRVNERIGRRKETSRFKKTLGLGAGLPDRSIRQPPVCTTRKKIKKKKSDHYDGDIVFGWVSEL